MTLNEIVSAAHKNAVEHGWWDEGDRNPLEIAALIHSEVSEFVEEARKGTPFLYKDEHTGKPEGQLAELADVIIRIADYCGRMGWDIQKAVKLKHEYNCKRSYRHGNKKY